MPSAPLFIGREVEGENQRVLIEGSRSRAVFVCGKRGSGKSYTMGVFLEELYEQSRQDALLVVADPMGIFHTMALPNDDQAKDLYDWGLTQKAIPIRLLVPGDVNRAFGGADIVGLLGERGVDVRQLRLSPSELSPDTWCSLFDLSINDLMGIALYRAISELQERGTSFAIQDIEKAITRDRRAQDRTKEALVNRINIASKWGIFGSAQEEGWPGLFRTDAINVIDLSVVDPGVHGLRSLIVDVICRYLFKGRTNARRREEFGLDGNLPRVWLALDEAHQFVPAGSSSLCKEILIRWVKEGRQPGLGLIAATQQPSAMDSEILSQCDLILSHKITSLEDMQALNRLGASYMSSEIRVLIRNLSRRGEAVLVDDEKESVTTVCIRPRRSRHGGGETVERKIKRSLF